jgi:hypothetical protein
MPVLPLRAAYRFANDNHLEAEVAEIQEMRIEWDHPPRPPSVRRGYVVALFEEKGLWEAFWREHWPHYETRDGQARYRKYKEFKAAFEAWEKEAEDRSEDAEGEANDPFAFALEAQLRDFIAHNLNRLPLASKTLRLRQDDQGDGVEYPTDVDQGDEFYVFELKVSRGPDRALGQLARYMGWVKKELAGGRAVHGVIVARSIDDKLRYAAGVMPNVTLLEYRVDFTLEVAPPYF